MLETHGEIVVNHEAMAASTRNIALGLLRCNRVVAHESAILFYRTNIFEFSWYHNWHPIISCLETIGARNRGYLTDLVAAIQVPVHILQQNDGTRVACNDVPPYEEIYQRDTHFSLLAGEPTEGIVENVNPVVAKLFALLGSDK